MHRWQQQSELGRRELGEMSGLLAIAGYMLVPGAIMVARNTIDFEDPENVLMLRSLCALVTALSGCALVYLYVQVITSPDKEKKVFVRPSQLYSMELRTLRDPNAPDDKVEMSYKEYDLSKLQDLAFKLGMTVCVTSLVHWYFDTVPVLVASVFMYPRIIYGTPFWRIYIRGETEKLHRELRRPWPDPKPNLGQRWQQQYADYLRELDADPAAEGAAAAPAAAGPVLGGKKAKKAAKRAAARAR